MDPIGGRRNAIDNDVFADQVLIDIRRFYDPDLLVRCREKEASSPLRQST